MSDSSVASDLAYEPKDDGVGGHLGDNRIDDRVERLFREVPNSQTLLFFHCTSLIQKNAISQHALTPDPASRPPPMTSPGEPPHPVLGKINTHETYLAEGTLWLQSPI